MPDDCDPLRYTDRIDWLIEQARQVGLSDEQIVRKLTVGRQYAEVKEIAKKWSPFIGIQYGDFLKLARRGPGKR